MKKKPTKIDGDVETSTRRAHAHYRSDERYSNTVAEQLAGFAAVLERLDRQMDKRLYEPSGDIAGHYHPHSQYGLCKRGGGGGASASRDKTRQQAGAGRQRSSRTWEEADAQLAAHRDEEKPPLVVWDESVVEKAETLASEDLGSVRSRRVALLKRTRPGFFFNPPGGRPVFVPGMEWITLLLLVPECRRCGRHALVDDARATRQPATG